MQAILIGSETKDVERTDTVIADIRAEGCRLRIMEDFKRGTISIVRCDKEGQAISDGNINLLEVYKKNGRVRMESGDDINGMWNVLRNPEGKVTVDNRNRGFLYHIREALCAIL
jgi:hypothetical protein